MTKLLVVSDTCASQINGVAHLLSLIKKSVPRYVGWQVKVVTSDDFVHFPFPPYPEIRLAYPHYRHIKELLDDYAPSHVHLLTEGPLGYMLRYICGARKISISSHYCTNMPEVLGAYAYLPHSLSRGYLKHFHGRSRTILVQSATAQKQLHENGMQHTSLVLPGIDDSKFRQDVPPPLIYNGLRRPILLCVSRLSHEKNIDDFCSLPASLGTKVMIGDGPLRQELEEKYPDVHFLGRIEHEKIAPFYKHADCFVFPSHKDTFGLVLLEAIASGLPIAAYSCCPGAQHVVKCGLGFLANDLAEAVVGVFSERKKREGVLERYFGAEAYAQRFCRALFKSELHLVV